MKWGGVWMCSGSTLVRLAEGRLLVAACLGTGVYIQPGVGLRLQTPEPNVAVSCSFDVLSLLYFSSALRIEACVWWILCTDCLNVFSAFKKGIRVSCVHSWRDVWGLDTFSLTPTSHPASKTANQHISPASRHSAASKRTVFNEADLGSQVFLEATFSEREHLRIC